MAKDKGKKAKSKDEDDAPEKEDEAKAEGASGEEGEGAAKKGMSTTKMLLFGAGGVVLIAAILAGLFFAGVFGKKEEVKTEGEAAAAHQAANGGEHGKDKKDGAPGVFYDLGEILVNLQSDGRRVNYLKIKIAIELADEKDKSIFEKVKPRIMDNFQVYLRELRVDDLRGSAGIYRLREELLMRVTEAAYPAKVRDVLFQEMLVQ